MADAFEFGDILYENASFCGPSSPPSERLNVRRNVVALFLAP